MNDLPIVIQAAIALRNDARTYEAMAADKRRGDASRAHLLAVRDDRVALAELLMKGAPHVDR